MRGGHSDFSDIAWSVCNRTCDSFWGGPSSAPQPLDLAASWQHGSASDFSSGLICLCLPHFEQERHFGTKIMSLCGQEYEWVPPPACGHTDLQDLTAVDLGTISKATQITKHTLIKSDSSPYCRSCLFICWLQLYQYTFLKQNPCHALLIVNITEGSWTRLSSHHLNII